uniref:uncharacterized protein LOC120335470 n=1 Tax=Styela clava TaxID=7725 RepID=UPI0019399DC7|nr:uncharacterized protein LOC120335470 [Styela clava]
MAAKPVSQEEPESLLADLNGQYRSAEELMLNPRNKEFLQSQVKEIDAMFVKYSEAYEIHVAELPVDEEAQRVAKESFQRESYGYEEFKAHVEEWLSRQESTQIVENPPSKPQSIASRKSSNMSRPRSARTASSYKSTSSSYKRTEAIAVRELAKLKMKQLSELEQAERNTEEMNRQAEELKSASEREIRRVQAIHEYQAACVEAEVWEIGSNRNERVQFQEMDSGPPIAQLVECEAARAEVNTPQVGQTNCIVPPREPQVRLSLDPVQEVVAEVMNPVNQEFRTRQGGTRQANLVSPVEVPNMPSQDVGSILATMTSTMRDMVDLPKPELLSFHGSHEEYTRFMNSFKINIENKISDDNLRLTYLQQFCKGKARELIRQCSVYPPTEGLTLAKRLLREAYGRPLLIARTYMEELIHGPMLKPDDRDSLLDLSHKMEECYLTLSHWKQYSDLNNFDNIAQLSCRLPLKYHNKWEEEAADYENRNIELKFEHLLKFVKKAAITAQSSMGKAMRAHKEREKAKHPQKKRIYANSTSTSGDGKPEQSTERKGTFVRNRYRCVICSKDHFLIHCPEFERKSASEREATIREFHICRNCLYIGHMARQCRKNPACTERGCGGRHHRMLHRNVADTKRKEQSTSSATQTATSGSTLTNYTRNSAGVYLNIVPVKVSSPQGREIEVYCFLDEGSTSCLCDKRLMELLEMDGEPMSYSITTVNTPNPQKQDGFALDLTVKPLKGEGCVTLHRVLTVDEIPTVPNKLPKRIELKRHEYLEGIEFPKLPDERVMLMIGVNVPEVFWVKDERRGTTNEPVAKRSILGWSLVGPAFNKASGNESFHVHVNHVEVKSEDLQQQIREMWETDFKDISLTPTPTLSREDKYALQLMEDNIKMVDGHYQSPLPWKPGCPEFPNNRDAVMRRTNNLGKRLLKNDVLRDKYCSTMAEFIKKGWARKIPAAEFEAPIGKAWYLPHQPVTSEQKPGKVRLVFDAGARYLNTSLNDQLLQGPDMANGLLSVLLRFRMYKYGITADIEAMFLQARVTPRDVDALRFLFWPDGDLTKTPVDHQMLVHCFGNTSSPFCANYCLRRTAEDFGKDFPSDINSISEGKRIVKQTSELTECGGFHLNKWRSNSEEIISCVPEKDRAQIQANVNLDPNRFERVLGVVWFVIEDCFGFNTKLKTKPATKRGVLAILSSVFDPMGIVSPVILQARLIFQELCRQQLGWDETIGANEQIAWESWTKAIPDLSEVKLPRYIKPNSFGVIVSQELHHFGDASQVAYGSVSYLRLSDENGQIHCSFLLGKSRLCPIKTICSLPRLEITAAALCVRVDMFLRRQLKFEKNVKSIFWSDSTATIQSIYNSSKRFPTFIANRLAKIEEGSEPHQWRYVPSELNPADYASRGMTAKKLIAKKSWLQGPEFLYQNEENWPQMPVKLPDLPLEFIQKSQ